MFVSNDYGGLGLPFQKTLEQLVFAIHGVTGALLIEADGEAVAWHAADNAERLRLRGAYVAVVLRACESAAAHLVGCSIGHLSMCYEGASFVAREIGSGYFLVLEFEPAANLAEALHRIEPFVERMREELLA